ncbi:DEAD/DEAH box helicase [Synechococcus sp. OH2]|uniref:DEAD/DEAH box helicase n=1 Tax=Synechococcus sp. OH2 TaxID=136798 RepID=UPI0039C024BB
MHFRPDGALDDSLPGIAAEAVVWNALRQGLGADAGYLFHRAVLYNHRRGNPRAEIDILLIHAELGIWVFECKGFNLYNIESINNNEWRMRQWQKETETPLQQAHKQMFQVKDLLRKNPDIQTLIDQINFGKRVALPRIRRQEWQERFGDPPLIGALVFADDLEKPEHLKQRLYEARRVAQAPLHEGKLKQIVRHLGLVLEDDTNSQPNYGYDSQMVIRRVQEGIFKLDEDQRKIATQYPEGPQRLRGLAGTGKTVVLTRRAAKIHADHPDWDIAVVFYTRSLYEQIRRQISEVCQSKFDIEPNWQKLRVMHAWGSQDQLGFYRLLAHQCGLLPKSLEQARAELRDKNDYTTEPFDYVCQELGEKAKEIPQLFDAILIDEGQDLPPAFYRLAYQTLRDPKRLYWAYDEAQGIGSLTVPGAAELFGRDETGKPKVRLGGRAIVLRHCYRTPNIILMAAHAINMGLLRGGQPLQGVTQKDQWEGLGYEVIEGDFRKPGSPITLTRKACHPVDQENFDPKVDPQSLLVWRTFPSEEEEQNWIAQQIERDLKQWSFRPEDLLVTSVASFRGSRPYWESLKARLKQRGISALIAGEDADRDIFRLPGHVTLSGIFRAKGNEAWKVYVCQFQNATEPGLSVEEQLRRRNQAFVALTRTKIWCVVTGISPKDQLAPAFQELRQAKEQYPYLRFPAFNKGSLRRVHEVDLDLEGA